MVIKETVRQFAPLDELTHEVKDLTVSLDELSNIIRKIEHVLEKENMFKMEFKYHANTVEGIFISWKRMKGTKKKKCRLYVQWVEREIERPLAELPVELKVEAAQYLFPFLEAFKEFVKDKTEYIQDKVCKMKSELECYEK